MFINSNLRALKIFIVVIIFLLSNSNYAFLACYPETGYMGGDCGSRSESDCESDGKCYFSSATGDSGDITVKGDSGGFDSRKVSINNPIGSNDKTNINEIIGKIIKGIMGVIGTLALVMFVFGGFMWMTSAGNSERVEKAKSIIVWNILGIIAIFSAYAIINFVLDSLK